MKLTFITSANRVEIQVENLQTGIHVDTQAIASIDWILNGFANAQPTTVTLVTSGETNLGDVINVTGNSGNTQSALTTITNRWGISAAGTTQVITGGSQIDVFGAGQPSQLIIGPEAYNNPNNSITTHNPFLYTNTGQHISFYLDYAPAVGITAATTINSITGFRPVLDFGTTMTTTQEVELIVELPEPESNVLIAGGLGLLLIGTIIRRYRRRTL